MEVEADEIYNIYQSDDWHAKVDSNLAIESKQALLNWGDSNN